MKKLAGSIKLKMSEQRQGATPDTERRWIWELIQNGKDVRYPDIPFKVEVSLTTNQGTSRLEFSHNGRPFSVKNITYLVEQVSSKDQEFESDGMPTNTGKFGTGFLTTHLLSERVKIETVIKAEGLNYKTCLVELDRSGREEAGIIQSIKESLSILEQLDEKPDLEHFNPSSFNTKFIYELEPHGVDVAKAGIKDLDDTLAFVLCFVQSIANVESNGTEYKLNSEKTTNIDNVYHYTIEKSDFLDSEEFEIIVVKGAKTQIAIPVKTIDGLITILPIQPNIPKLFCDFPLTGTESFPFPAMINSPFFNLNDPRSIVRLTEINEPEIKENKELIIEARDLFLKLLSHIETKKSGHTYNLTKNIVEIGLDWISPDWYKSNIFDILHKQLSKTEIVDTYDGGRRSVQNNQGDAFVLFPSSANTDIREDIFNLAAQWFPYALPKREEIHHWWKSLFPGCTRLTLKLFSQWISNQEKIQTLSEKLVENTDTIKWLNSYYFLLNKEELFIKDVVANEIKILPDQNGEFQLMKDLQFDPGLDEIIKDCLRDLGRDIRSELRMTSINTAVNMEENAKHKIGHGRMKIDDIYSSLNNLLKQADDQTAFDVATILTRTVSSDQNYPVHRQNIFSAFKRMYPDRESKEIPIKKYDSRLYEESDNILLLKIIKDISISTTVEEFSEQYSFYNSKEAIQWIANYIKILSDLSKNDYLQISDSPILPNQNGEFRIKDALSFGIPDDGLKDIAKRLGHDFREYLIDSKIDLEFDPSREITNKNIAEKISALIGNLMADMQQDDETKQTFQLLFRWFNINPSIAESLFGELYHNRHRLCTPDEIVSSIEKAATLDSLLKERGLNNVNELRALLDQGQPDNERPPLTEITQDILLSLGISNYDDFKKALEDKNLAELFGHQSVPSSEYFLFVQAIIERTRNKVKTFLESIGYDFSEAELTATTVYSGVVKNNSIIDIVFRPSDNNEVIFYYGSEKQTLQNPTAELWVADGLGTPEQITLGQVLIVNRIVKVRI